MAKALHVTASLVIVLLLSGAPTDIFAESGSTGGSIGNGNKTLSGSDTQQPQKPVVHPVHRRAHETAPVAAGPRGPKVLVNPTIRGIRVDWCMTSALDDTCGEVAATTLCRSRGYTRSINFKWHIDPPTYRQGEHSVCSGTCGAFTEVTCE